MTRDNPWRWIRLAALSLTLASLASVARAKDDPARASEAPGESSHRGSTSATATQQASSTLNRAAARKLYVQGTQHVEAGELSQARRAYRRSFELYPSPSTLVNLAYCEGELGHLVEAWWLLSRALVLFEQGRPGWSATRRAAVQTERERLRARLSSVLFQGPGSAELVFAGASIVAIPGTVGMYRLKDNTQASWVALPVGSRIYVDPGKYRIGHRWDGQAAYQELDLTEGAVFGLLVSTPRRTVTAPPATASRPYHAVGVGGLIAAGLGFTSALISAGVLLDAKGKLGESCSSEAICPSELAGTVSRYQTAVAVTNVGLISGVVASAIGIGFLIVDGAGAQAGLGVQASGASVHLRARF